MTGFLGKRSNGQGRSAQNRASVKEFEDAQRRLLERFGLRAESRLVDVPAIGGRAHVLVVGQGPIAFLALSALIFVHDVLSDTVAIASYGIDSTVPKKMLGSGAVRFRNKVDVLVLILETWRFLTTSRQC
ncbi:hypothetical protein [Mycobacterium marinum]|uniref:hypothetical protein n=1 Tax=Mycobacterium marinum TaxID=1781 RepID=UPI0023583DEE|nr:hypothetical protein [Mycobacterium marinum]MDC9014895.1 hypothetical protein [Mycobacterium marinum]